MILSNFNGRIARSQGKKTFKEQLGPFGFFIFVLLGSAFSFWQGVTMRPFLGIRRGNSDIRTINYETYVETNSQPFIVDSILWWVVVVLGVTFITTHAISYIFYRKSEKTFNTGQVISGVTVMAAIICLIIVLGWFFTGTPYSNFMNWDSWVYVFPISALILTIFLGVKAIQNLEGSSN